MDQAYARGKYVKKYIGIYESVFDRDYHVDVYRTKVEDDEYETGRRLFPLEHVPEYRYYGSTDNYPEASKKAIKKTTSIFAKDILESKMMKELDEYSLYLVIRSLHQKGILTFRQEYSNNEILMSVVIMRYISIIPKLIKLDTFQRLQDVLIYSIQEEDLPLLSALVEAMKINELSTYTYGLARHTAKNKSTAILEFLIKNNMSHDQLDMKSAKEENNQEMINVLLEKSPYLLESYRNAILFDRDIELAKKILKTNRLDVKKNDMFIKFAVSCTEDAELVQMLIDAGANVNAKYDAKDAMSYRACISYRKAIEEGIEDFGNILTKAEMQHKFEIAELLKKAGAKILTYTEC